MSVRAVLEEDSSLLGCYVVSTDIYLNFGEA